MDALTTIEPEMLLPDSEEPSSAEPKKAISSAKLALIDLKRAKRRSAAMSKDRKMRYIAELERKLQALQTEEMYLSAELSLLQKGTDDLTAQNSEMKLELQTLERQVHLIDALDEAVKEEVQHLEVRMGRSIQNGEPMMKLPASYGAKQQHFPDNDDMDTLLAVQQFQQLHIHSPNQQQRSSMQPQAQARDSNLRRYVPSPIQKDNATSGASSED